MTEEEMRRVEEWARASKHERMLEFFEGLPRRIFVPRDLLLGSNGNKEVCITLHTTRNEIASLIVNLDGRYNPYLTQQLIKGGEERTTKSPHAWGYIVKELKKGFPELCLASDLGSCEGPISRSHSIQKCVFEKYASNGHVYEFDPFHIPIDGQHWPEKVGVRQATTFTGFCNYHDTQLFRPIENMPFVASPEQIFLYHYRAIAFCFYQRHYKATLFERALHQLKKDYPEENLKKLEDRVISMRFDSRDVKAYKDKYDDFLRSADWRRVEGIVLIGERPPDVFGCEFFAPSKDFEARVIQDTRRTRGILDSISLTVTAFDDQALILLCGNRGSSALRLLKNSLRHWKACQQTMAILNRVFCQFENFVIVPAWWDSLKELERLKLVNAFNSRFYPRKLPFISDWKLQELTQCV